MIHGTKIEWTHVPGYKGETWNPVRGCTRVSEGCRNCYAEIMAARFSGPGQWGQGFAELKGGDHRWTGKVALVEDALTLPLKWRKPRAIFVNSTSDLFHEQLPDEAIDRVFAVMALCPQHIFSVLSKRLERARAYRNSEALIPWKGAAIGPRNSERLWPNVWLGASVEDQATADERIPHLLATPAAVRFVSYEPALGPVDFRPWLDRLDLIIAGGESGPGARPAHPDWFRGVRDQCQAAGVAFFFKQWGEWAPSKVPTHWVDTAGMVRMVGNGAWASYAGVRKVGKAKAGALLDGREHREFPKGVINAD